MIYDDDMLLAKRAAKGDEQAFAEIVRANQDFIYNLCIAGLRSHHDALDVSQETFIKAYRAIGNYRGDSKLSSWLYRICMNCISDFKRKNGAETVPIDPDENGEGGLTIPANESDSSPEYAAERSERINEVRRAIASLPEEWRQLIVLREYEGKSYAEIADLTGLEEGTVKSRLNRARNKIKDFLTSRNFSP